VQEEEALDGIPWEGQELCKGEGGEEVLGSKREEEEVVEAWACILD
jgi:hypothetical protein